MKISIIVAHGKNREIGYNNRMLWNIPEDFKNFKRLTTGHHVIMGRKTFESIVSILGKPLPNRTSIVMSYSEFKTDFDNVISFINFDDAIRYAEEKHDSEVFIIGGAEIYNKFIIRANALYISEIDYEGDADAFLNPIDYSNFELVSEVPYEATEKSPAWTFKHYEKKGN
jgi:dihydrofolate reductase